jgi:hypothetical protein
MVFNADICELFEIYFVGKPHFRSFQSILNIHLIFHSYASEIIRFYHICSFDLCYDGRTHCSKYRIQ